MNVEKNKKRNGNMMLLTFLFFNLFKFINFYKFLNSIILN